MAGESSEGSRKLGEIATRVLFENERVRIWEMRMPAGEQGPVHEHALDHLLIQISGDRMAVVPEPDTKSVYAEYMEADVEPGKVFFVERGGIESAKNVGKEDFHEIIVELKD
jgi:quercetin dioxygenase-like cupin family protein